MLVTPAIIALHLIAVSVTGTVVLASGFAVRILRYWNIHSGSELQIRLERQTYLISTLLGFALCAELLSLLLFVYTAENLSSQFVGAMCATGVLNVNAFGFPSLLLKMAIFFLAALWLLLNSVDQRGYDYPLVRLKYWMLLAIAPLTVVEALVQTIYLLRLEPDVITSCCGSLFGSKQSVAAELASLPPKPTMILFYVMGGAILLLGLAFRRRLALGPLFAVGNFLNFGVALTAIIAFLSLYLYENPHHHCPFCLLKSGYDYLGYALYLPLFAATASGLGAGLLAQFRSIPSLHPVIPGTVQRLIWITLSGFGLFYALATWLILRSNLVLFG